jgi:hypothetical protein
LLKHWFNQRESRRGHWCFKHGLVMARVKSFVSSSKYLLERTNAAVSAERRWHRPNSRPISASKALSFEQIATPLSAESQNLLRLIMTWSCEPNILKGKVKSKVRDFDFNTVIVRSPRLTNASISSVLRKHCEWTLVNYTEKVFNSKFCGGTRTLRDVISSMIRLSWLPVVSILQKVEKKKVACLVAIERNQFSEESQLFEKDLHLLLPSALFFGEFPYEDDANKKTMYGLFYEASCDKKIVKKLKELHAGLDKSMYLEVLKDSNCAIRMVGSDKISVECLKDILWGESHRFDWKLTEHIVQEGQRIEFPHPSKHYLPGSLIVDLPIGLKILSGCRGMYKNYKLRLRPIEYYGLDVNTKSSNVSHKAVPGSVEYAAARASALEQRATIKDTSEIETCSVETKMISVKWENVETLSGVTFSKSSYLSTSCHCDTKATMLSVAYNILEVLTPNGDLTSFAEGITLLPIGGRWISLAKLCIGSDIPESLQFSSKKISGHSQHFVSGLNYNGDINHPISEVDRRNCGEVYQYFEHVYNEPIEFSPQLRTMVCDIFADWIGAFSHNDITSLVVENKGDSDSEEENIAETDGESVFQRADTSLSDELSVVDGNWDLMINSAKILPAEANQTIFGGYQARAMVCVGPTNVTTVSNRVLMQTNAAARASVKIVPLSNSAKISYRSDSDSDQSDEGEIAAVDLHQTLWNDRMVTSTEHDRPCASAAVQNVNECELCRAELSSGNELRKHMDTHFNVTLECYQGDMCSMSASSRAQLLEHQKRIHGSGTTCDLAKTTAQMSSASAPVIRNINETMSSALESTASNTNKIKSRTCEVCGAVLASKRDKRKHVTLHPKVKCSGKSLDPLPLSIEQHMRSRHGTSLSVTAAATNKEQGEAGAKESAEGVMRQRTFSCNMCGQPLRPRLSDIKGHMLLRHSIALTASSSGAEARIMYLPPDLDAVRQHMLATLGVMVSVGFEGTTTTAMTGADFDFTADIAEENELTTNPQFTMIEREQKAGKRTYECSQCFKSLAPNPVCWQQHLLAKHGVAISLSKAATSIEIKKESKEQHHKSAKNSSIAQKKCNKQTKKPKVDCSICGKSLDHLPLSIQQHMLSKHGLSSVLAAFGSST